MTQHKSLGFELRNVTNLFKRKADNISNISIDQNVTVMHGWVLGYLMRHQDTEVTQRDFERDFSMRKSTVSRALQLMEKNGLIKREPVEYDARLKKIGLTNEAIEIQKAIAEAMEKAEQEAIIGISKQKLDVFYEVLAEIKKNLE